MLFPFGNIDPCHIVHIDRSSSWICFGGQPFHHCRSNLFDDTGAHLGPCKIKDFAGEEEGIACVAAFGFSRKRKLSAVSFDEVAQPA